MAILQEPSMAEFDHISKPNITAIFVLGGPGSGKSGQCAQLAQEYGMSLVYPGALLREEQNRSDSPFKDIIKSHMQEGRVMPGNLTMQLLEQRMSTMIASGNRRFILDGFPRTVDQLSSFERSIAPSKLILFLDCPEDIMTARLLDRAKTSGRLDDNKDSIQKRMGAFIATSMTVVDSLKGKDRVITVDATKSPASVYQDIRGELSKAGIEAEKLQLC